MDANKRAKETKWALYQAMGALAVDIPAIKGRESRRAIPMVPLSDIKRVLERMFGA